MPIKSPLKKGRFLSTNEEYYVVKLKAVFLSVFLIISVSGAVHANIEDVPAKKMKVRATAYYLPLKNQKTFFLKSYEKDIRMNGGSRTSSGTIPTIGTIAADKKVFPPGTILHVPGYGRGIVEDTGGAIKGSKIDLFMGPGESGLKKAKDWGVQYVTVEVIKE